MAVKWLRLAGVAMMAAAAPVDGISASYNWIFQGGSGDPTPAFSYPPSLNQVGYPRARSQAAIWTLNNGDVYMFGGRGKDEGVSVAVFLGDFWQFDSTAKEWRWIGGSSAGGALPVYPAQHGQPGTPGARYGAATWTDSAGVLWMFGGYGRASDGTGKLADLWKYHPLTKQWTHEAGPQTVQFVGDYPAGVNQTGYPAARSDAVTGMAATGDLLLFGGSGTNMHNDLWKFSPSSPTVWTLLGGSDQTDVPGVYPAAHGGVGYPGSRYGAAFFTDSDNNLWIFGGYGFGATGPGFRNDLWLYQPATNTFTWMSGLSDGGAPTIYPAQYNFAGTLGGRNMPQFWSNGEKLWVSGGFGPASPGGNGRYNDLWSFDPDEMYWRFIDGPRAEIEGDYPADTGDDGLPHGRMGGACWYAAGELGLFGGSQDGTSPLNDMWTHPGYPNSTVGEWNLY